MDCAGASTSTTSSRAKMIPAPRRHEGDAKQRATERRYEFAGERKRGYGGCDDTVARTGSASVLASTLWDCRRSRCSRLISLSNLCRHAKEVDTGSEAGKGWRRRPRAGDHPQQDRGALPPFLAGFCRFLGTLTNKARASSRLLELNQAPIRPFDYFACWQQALVQLPVAPCPRRTVSHDCICLSAAFLTFPSGIRRRETNSPPAAAGMNKIVQN